MMMLVSIDTIPGKQYEVLGIVKGTIVQTKNLGRDFMAAMKTLVGGEIVGYTEMRRRDCMRMLSSGSDTVLRRSCRVRPK